ncbi:unnamed protein product [Eruca vesicaria subsp. sativa]|uniref:Uncharacterized protein n=1 Tax=Eruca vesicaria subsp. sativa TaxID=29727 RepID=A0ABC8LXF6_ERUVS|nr:unnamed protein product [Eruca vesicaria subsp. sativa]
MYIKDPRARTPNNLTLTGIKGGPLLFFRSTKPFDIAITKSEIIALCCEKVLYDDNTEAAVRVAAIDRNFKIIIHQTQLGDS